MQSLTSHSIEVHDEVHETVTHHDGESYRAIYSEADTGLVQEINKMRLNNSWGSKIDMSGFFLYEHSNPLLITQSSMPSYPMVDGERA